MKKTSIKFALLLFLLVGKFNCHAQNPGDVYFNAPIVHEININFLEPNWYDTLAQYKWLSDNLDSTVYLPASVIIDGSVLDSVGIRFKGNSSYYNYSSTKKPFKLDFNRFVSGQSFDNLKKMNLNNLYQDPTFMREKMFLDFVRQQGLNGPRAAYSKVYVNGTYWGLYLSVDQIDKTFLDWNYGNKDGNLFKGDGSSSSCANLKYHGTMSSYYTCYELKTNEIVNDWSDLVNLTFQINQTTNNSFRDSLEAVMNTPSFIGTWACYNLFANFDSYPYRFSHNYYTYHNTNNDKFEWIVWDVSTAFGNDIPWTVSAIENAGIYFIWPQETDRPLSYRMLQDSLYKQEYTDYICQYVQEFSPTLQLPIIDSLYAAIKTDVYADNLKMYTNTQFDNNINSTITISGATYPGLKPFISNRYTSVQSQLSSLNCTSSLSLTQPSANTKDVLFAPNPFSDFAILAFENSSNENYSLIIYDAQGRLVRTISGIVSGNVVIERQQLTKGLYFFQLQSDSQLYGKGKFSVD